MPDYRRISIKGGTYFFTVVTHNRQPFLLDMEVRKALREGIQEVRKSLPFIIEAWVLLPDHLHTIWTLPEGDSNYQARWAIIKRAVTKKGLVRKTHPTFTGDKVSASMQKRQEGVFWQRRFWEHVIRDEADFHRHLDYLHWNPVKHGYVKTPMDWPYSTFHRFVGQGLYPSNWGGNGADEDSSDNFGE